MKPVVFAGPSIYGLPAASFEGIDLRPPAIRGDLLAAMRDGAERIGLVDGGFEGAPSVWHKEILAALDAGIWVLGASSMGALRAAECAAFGMTGIGAVFESYHCGMRVSDADVAMQHAPAELDYMPLTVALVDAEAGAAAMCASGCADAAEAALLVASARALHFKERTWQAIVAGAGLQEHRARPLLDQFLTGMPSQKREDAAALLAAITGTRPPLPAKTFAFASTLFWAGLRAEHRRPSNSNGS
jgi:hypothetical protein